MVDEMFFVEWGVLEHMDKFMFCVGREAMRIGVRIFVLSESSRPHEFWVIWVEIEALEHMKR